MSASKDGMGEGVFRGHSQRNRKFVEFESAEDVDDGEPCQGCKDPGCKGLIRKGPGCKGCV